MTNNTPVVIFFFNRRHVLQVINQIRKYQPNKLYLVADGGRDDEEHQKCLAIRKAVDAMIDWKCDVIRKYKGNNLGVDVVMPKTISEIFQTEETLIILEDDCVPDISFFDYCEVLLDKYQSNSRVMSISGVNWFSDISFTKNSYFFSIHNGGPGWATWRDAWVLYDNNMTTFRNKNSKFIEQNIRHNDNYMTILYFILFRRHYLPTLNNTLNNDQRNSPWDGKWLYALFVNRGLSIVPCKNLITNIGFDASATHTKKPSFMANQARYSIEFPLAYEDNIVANAEYDKTQAKRILNFTYLKFLRTKLKIMLRIGHLYKV